YTHRHHQESKCNRLQGLAHIALDFDSPIQRRGLLRQSKASAANRHQFEHLDSPDLPLSIWDAYNSESRPQSTRLRPRRFVIAGVAVSNSAGISAVSRPSVVICT